MTPPYLSPAPLGGVALDLIQAVREQLAIVLHEIEAGIVPSQFPGEVVELRSKLETLDLALAAHGLAPR